MHTYIHTYIHTTADIPIPPDFATRRLFQRYATSLYLFTQSWLSRSGSITASRIINIGIFIGVSFVSVSEKVTALVLVRQRKLVLKIKPWNIVQVLIQVTYQMFIFYRHLKEFASLIFSSSNYSMRVSFSDSIFSWFISSFSFVSFVYLLFYWNWHFTFVTSISDDFTPQYLSRYFYCWRFSEECGGMVFPLNKFYSWKRRVCPDFEKLHKKFIYNNASEKLSLSVV